MPKSAAPIDLLRRLRAHFATEAEQYRAIEKTAPNVEAKQIAAVLRERHERFVSDIDVTLRDWG